MPNSMENMCVVPIETGYFEILQFIITIITERVRKWDPTIKWNKSNGLNCIGLRTD